MSWPAAGSSRSRWRPSALGRAHAATSNLTSSGRSVSVASPGDGGREAAAGEDFESEVAASFGPFVALFDQHGPYEADDRVAVGEDPDHIRAAADLPVQLLVGYIPSTAPCYGYLAGAFWSLCSTWLDMVSGVAI